MSAGAPNRRTVLTALGVGLAAAGCGVDRPVSTAPPGGSAPACVLTPEGTEGPYYVDTDLVRGDIREDRPGIPLALRVSVVDAGACAPLRGAAVDIWHADAHGDYSGLGEGSRFLRGIQHTDDAGTATFATIFPGWYDNRTVHIHVKVHVGGREIHTGQLYFDDEITSAVATFAPYTDRTEPRTRNDRDFLFRRGHALLAVSGHPSEGYRAEITLGINT
ncbi:intradiol ring-cleavage dioxygenase [Nocardia puris]|uniref:intradiol ring-cleavage dioxygenase n=1 Tax=Nocardia puris TaxID=208602 RepID=UPI001895A02A|nr:intradiol ring-cleavage dioxygenase [Nocardia puris]MBF6214132.1 intradiol ring-cleavage dioxygenase [Nocardia puris]MBF6365378.1 intradiol ring-cleavage dioxygenase [Nocardia puris]MBF6459780.1 intradiol ring-cleavage dioxygenase [Nocardia puris]